MDLIHDHEILGHKNNFNGTVNVGDPFNSYMHGQCDNKVDDVVDSGGYKNSAGM